MSQASSENQTTGVAPSGLRYLSFAPGQTWSGWALFEGGSLLETGITMTESFLENYDQSYLDKLDIFNRRLLGLRLSVQGLLVTHAPLDYFVAWNPSATATVGYAARAGQYVGIMKSTCYEHGLPVIDVNDDDAHSALGIVVDAPRDELEQVVTARLTNLSLPSRLGTYDSGAEFKASPIDAITVGWAASERFRHF
jgi:hypothetical protein